MKKVPFIILFFISAISFAQGKFIEVEVTDTISLKPVSYKCNLYVDTYDYDMVVEAAPIDPDGTATAAPDENAYDNYDPLVAEEKAKNKLAAIKKSLEQKKFRLLPLEDPGAGLLERRMYDQTGFTVVVNSKEELQALKDFISSRRDITASVASIKYADEQKSEEVLIKRLMDRAKAKAAIIGANSALKPGRIIEVKEGRKGNDITASELYAQILKMSSYGQGMDTTAPGMTKTLVVKFEAE